MCDLEVPSNYISESGFKLGTWIGRMRLRNNGYRATAPLTADQIRRLEDIGMRWENANMLCWCDNLEAVGRYPRTLNGIPIVPEDAVSEYGTNLIRWAERQYRKYSQGQLKPEQRKLWEKMLQSG